MVGREDVWWRDWLVERIAVEITVAKAYCWWKDGWRRGYLKERMVKMVVGQHG